MKIATFRRTLPQDLLRGAALLFAIAGATPAMARDLEPAMRDEPMAEARAALARGDSAEALSRFLRVLASEPDNLDALSGAGRAALDIGDPNNAIAFFARAEEVAPRNGRIKAGLGSAMVQMENPRAALRFFDDAVSYGVPVTEIAADRGLAYDLRGDNKRAQADYALALRGSSDPETVRRLALSQAISGDRAAALATLDPLLRKQDIPAWRARAFVLAITGDAVEAEKAAAAVMPRPQAEALRPYLARIGTLKAGQKAAAVHFGHFPVDRKLSVAAQMAAAGPVPISTGVGAKQVPAGVPLDQTDGTEAVPATTASPVTRPLSLISPRVTLMKDEKRGKSEAKPAKPAKPAAPERIWVQVAGGANKETLPKAWAALKAKYPRQLAGHTPSTMAYRFTNRLVVGPFKTNAEAQAFVNAGAKAGLPSFAVTSAAGQEVERLSVK